MNGEQCKGNKREIPNGDWERTPLSVKQWVETQAERLEKQEQEIAELKKQLAALQAKIENLCEQNQK